MMEYLMYQVERECKVMVPLILDVGHKKHRNVPTLLLGNNNPLPACLSSSSSRGTGQWKERRLT
jgi:hypothetical protein